MAVSDDDDDAKFAITEYAVMGQAGEEFAWVAAQAGDRAAPTRSASIWRAWAHPSSAISNMAERTRAARARSPTSCICMRARIDIAHPDGGRLQVTAPLSPHMVKSWELLGFDPDDKRDPFPKKKSRPSGGEAMGHKTRPPSSEAIGHKSRPSSSEGHKKKKWPSGGEGHKRRRP